MALLPAAGVGNSLWAFGVLCFWHEPFVQAGSLLIHATKSDQNTPEIYSTCLMISCNLQGIRVFVFLDLMVKILK